MADSFMTLAKTGEGYYESKKSKFYGICRSVSTREEAQEFLNYARDRWKDASHYVMAFTLRNGTAQASDDGEPSGTAGKPLLDCLERQKITDAAVIVVRYFGGTLLGTGGLVRAYSSCAQDSVNNAGRAIMTDAELVLIECDYSVLKPVQLLLRELKAVENRTEYTDRVSVEVWCLSERTDEMISRITDLTGGKAEFLRLEHAFKPETFFS
ncbi:MAG: YigZ family protein [Oscillospiraceae bacterium]|nr:YigZ family protein [Oscillospiraceae bacterium]